MKTLAIIPARGGSKGVPRKNVRHLKQKPMIVHSIDAARNARLVSEIIVTTDDAEIAAIAEAEGVFVLRRPAELADDAAPMFPVIMHALGAAEEKWGAFDAMTLLQPTCPFRRAEHVDSSLELLERDQVEGVFGVYQLSHVHPARMYRVEDGQLEPLQGEDAARNRQDLQEIYQRNGAIYTLRCAALKAQQKTLVHPAAPLVMTPVESINIDEPFDWTVAEAFADEYL